MLARTVRDRAGLAAGKAAALLREAEGEQREQTLHALGGTPHDGAVELLIHELAQRTLSEERQPVIAALGLSLRPSARACLLALVQGDREADAEAALSALAIHRYDARLVDQLRAATAHSRSLANSFANFTSASLTWRASGEGPHRRA